MSDMSPDIQVRRPRIGDIVLYYHDRDFHQAGGAASPPVGYPAIITHVWPDAFRGMPNASMSVFSPSPALGHRPHIGYAERPTPGCWGWLTE